MRYLASKLSKFYLELEPPSLPAGFEILHPQAKPEVAVITKLFFKKFYADPNPRQLVLGINPGRFGAGITGINFTAARQLSEDCGIENPWGKQSELSAEFIYQVIRQYGGAKAFYRDFFIGSLSPLGYVHKGRNCNYYDDPKLLKAVKPFIVKSLQQQLDMGFDRKSCFCIGGEKNFKFLLGLNKEYGFFEEIRPLPHPRFIMQYRRKQIPEYIALYLNALGRTQEPE